MATSSARKRDLKSSAFRLAWIAGVITVTLIQVFPMSALSAEELGESTVYGTYAALPMGNPGEVEHRDFYVNIGSKEGVKVGSRIEVLRKIPTHDLLTRRLQKDMIFPIAVLKVIHVEQTAAVARLDRIITEESAPAISPRAVMVGDLVRPTR